MYEMKTRRPVIYEIFLAGEYLATIYFTEQVENRQVGVARTAQNTLRGIHFVFLALWKNLQLIVI